MTESPNHPLAQSPTGTRADLLERHEETSNAEIGRRIGGEIMDRSDVLAFCARPELGGGIRCACRIRSDAAGIQALVQDVAEWFAQRGAAPVFRASPLSRPETLATILAANGFEQTERETQMVLAGEDVERAANPDVTVVPAAPEDMRIWVDIQHRSFGGGNGALELGLEVARAMPAMGGQTPFLARLDGEWVGAGILTEWAGAFGIYGVATLPAARGRGVATALVRRMMRQPRAGAPLCLQAETGSTTQLWYERLGFRVVYDRTGWTRTSQK